MVFELTINCKNKEWRKMEKETYINNAFQFVNILFDLGFYELKLLTGQHFFFAFRVLLFC